MYYWLAGLIDMMKYQTPPSARATTTLWWSPDSRLLLRSNDCRRSKIGEKEITTPAGRAEGTPSLLEKEKEKKHPLTMI